MEDEIYVINKGAIKRVELLSKGYDNSLIRLEGREIYYKNSNLIESMDLAIIALKEYKITRNFKKMNKNKICSCCGKRYDNLTVDHIIPLKSFGKRNEIRKNKAIWKQAWSANNLQLLCESCNKIKNTMSDENFREYMCYLNDRGNKLKNKKINGMNRIAGTKSANRSQSPSYCMSLNNKLSQEVMLKLAKMDSRILYIK
ncbi:HNH endonuclease [Paraclostridium sordellii]|uniref:HNH endonuclease n=1 Tax=Paraclostridium sordellii TaxID=1505 RepID=UPI0022E5D1A1|nr:HNH endonuclease signature motif containing protein [Paeniclostridium sordellii]